MKRAVPYIIGMGDLQRQASAVIKSIGTRYGEGFIVSHNEPRAVLMSLRRYTQLKTLEEAKRSEEDDVLAIIQAGDREYDEGKTRKTDLVVQAFHEPRSVFFGDE